MTWVLCPAVFNPAALNPVVLHPVLTVRYPALQAAGRIIQLAGSCFHYNDRRGQETPPVISYFLKMGNISYP